MPFRYLFGPVSTAFVDENLRGSCRGGACVAFDESGRTGLAIRPTDSWDDVCRRLPPDWRPDFIALSLAYTSIPPCLWSAPVPRIGLAADWNLRWHHQRRCGRACELLLSDPAGVERFHQEGLRHARAASLVGCPADLVETPAPDVPRDIDILFAGNLHEAIQRQRLPWLTRLARLANHRRVLLTTGVAGADYRALLGRARIVFNYATRGECNPRVFEAVAAGALLFQEAGNREVPAFFRDGGECVDYTSENLETLLEHYLDHEADRRALAEAARARLPQLTFPSLWAGHLGLIEREWPDLQERLRHCPEGTPQDDLNARTWQLLGSTLGTDPHLAHDLAAALVRNPTAAELHNALGLVTAVTAAGQATPSDHVLDQVAGYFQRAWSGDPRHVVAGLNLAEALVQLRRFPQAAQQVRAVLDVLDRQPALVPANLDAVHYPAGFDYFRVEWERAAWAHAGQPAAEAQAKRTLIRWRLHTMLAQLTGDLAHYYEAALSRPDLPLTQAALGCALGRQRRHAEAIAHLEQAVAAQPFDLAAVQALAGALGEVGDIANQRRLARDRELLCRAAPSLVPPEAWFTEASPVGDELASIIILCCNQLPYTRLCLESVLRHTRPPYELVVVDNGSRDDTPACLNDLAAHAGPVRVCVLRNETNRGFPAGCNQALARARGRFLVFLNNDTVVTDGWLEGLIRCCLGAWPTVGLVGPVSNYAIAPQQVPAEYTDPEGLAAFAAHQRRAAGRASAVERLSGFCFLARRELFDRIGGFDERFGLGFFDDDDLGLRTRAAGLRLAVAQDVFVHHFGSRTFLGLGIDCRQQLQQNFELFRAKWGPEHTAGYRLPEPAAGPLLPVAAPLPPAAPAARHAATVSLCLIVKNEEANLPACLKTVADLVHEVVVVDTGSSDRTRALAQQLGARVFDFAWVDSFAAARNETLRHARGQWIFWMDADDRLDEANRARLRRLFANLGDENAAYAMKCLCLPDPSSQAGTVVDHIRLFRNHPAIRWQYRVHEQILPAVRALGGEARATDIVIHHVGYQDPALRARKQQRDFRLLQLGHADNPDEPFTLFNLGWALEQTGRPAEALPLLRRSLEQSPPGASIVRKLFTLIMECYRQMGHRAEALAVCREGRRYYPDDAALLFQEAALHRDNGDLAAAEACLLRLMGTEEEPHFASVAEGLRTFHARHLLGLVYQDQGRLAEAEAQWRAALDANPQFAPARSALRDLLAGQNRLGERPG